MERDPEWNSDVVYDYGFRIYDPRISRFLSVDPLTKSYPSWSPYPFAMNRPIDGIDLDGLEWMPMINPIDQGGTALNTLGNCVYNKGKRANEKAEAVLRNKQQISGEAPSTLETAQAYFWGWVSEFGEFTDQNDVSVLTQGRNVDGSNADGLDYAAAAAGIAIPFVSGSAIGNAIEAGTSEAFQSTLKGLLEGANSVKSNKSIVAQMKGNADDALMQFNKLTEGVDPSNITSTVNKDGKTIKRAELSDGTFVSYRAFSNTDPDVEAVIEVTSKSTNKNDPGRALKIDFKPSN